MCSRKRTDDHSGGVEAKRQSRAAFGDYVKLFVVDAPHVGLSAGFGAKKAAGVGEIRVLVGYAHHQ